MVTTWFGQYIAIVSISHTISCLLTLTMAGVRFLSPINPQAIVGSLMERQVGGVWGFEICWIILICHLWGTNI